MIRENYFTNPQFIFHKPKNDQASRTARFGVSLSMAQITSERDLECTRLDHGSHLVKLSARELRFGQPESYARILLELQYGLRSAMAT